MNMPSVHLKL